MILVTPKCINMITNLFHPESLVIIPFMQTYLHNFIQNDVICLHVHPPLYYSKQPRVVLMSTCKYVHDTFLSHEN